MSYVTEEYRQESRDRRCPECGGDAVEVAEITKVNDKQEDWNVRLMCNDCDVDAGAMYSVTYPNPFHPDIAAIF